MDRFFQYINIFPMPLWLAMMFAPQHRWTKRAAQSDTIFIIAAANYLVSLFIQSWLNSGSLFSRKA
jgi:hypothetical protein